MTVNKLGGVGPILKTVNSYKQVPIHTSLPAPQQAAPKFNTKGHGIFVGKGGGQGSFVWA